MKEDEFDLGINIKVITGLVQYIKLITHFKIDSI